MIEIEVTNRQTIHPIDAPRLSAAVEAVLSHELATSATISVAVVDAAEIWRLNREFLQHDYPTDVLSFVLEQGPDGLDGEIVCSADMAEKMAPHYGWSAADELLLYVVHGALHLAGHDDSNPSAAAEMRRLERHYLAALGVISPEPAAAESADCCTVSSASNCSEAQS